MAWGLFGSDDAPLVIPPGRAYTVEELRTNKVVDLTWSPFPVFCWHAYWMRRLVATDGKPRAVPVRIKDLTSGVVEHAVVQRNPFADMAFAVRFER